MKKVRKQTCYKASLKKGCCDEYKQNAYKSDDTFWYLSNQAYQAIHAWCHSKTSVLGAIKSVLKTQVKKETASQETQDSRLSICQQCEHASFKPDGTIARCGKIADAFKSGTKPCGCAIKLKIQDLDMKCPVGKW